MLLLSHSCQPLFFLLCVFIISQTRSESTISGLTQAPNTIITTEFAIFLKEDQTCDFCDISCKTCSRIPTNCTKCFDDSTLTSENNCIQALAPNVNVVVHDFFNVYSLDSTWSTNSAAILTNICGPYSFLGGYNALSQKHWLAKTMLSLPEHSFASISFHFFKIGVWDGELVIQIDSNTELKHNFTTIYENIDCGMISYLQNVARIEVLVPHTALSTTVNISTTMNVTGYWAVSCLTIALYNCAASCWTCSMPNDPHMCLSCRNGYFLKFPDRPTSCEPFCPDNHFKDNITNECQICDASCLTCQGATSLDCTTCPTGYMLLNSSDAASSCILNSSALGFHVESSPRICQSCDNSCLNCTGTLSSNCTDCKSKYFLDSTTNRCMPCDISCSECVNSLANGCIKCDPKRFYLSSMTNSTHGSCFPINFVTPALDTSKEPLIVYLKFSSSNYSSIYKLYSNESSIEIEGINSSAYNFSIVYDISSDSFVIEVKDVTFSIINLPILTLDLNTPYPILLKYPDFQLIAYSLQIQLQKSYYLDDYNKRLLDPITQATNVLSQAVATTFIMNNAISIGSFSFISCMVSMNSILLLQYLQIDYPQNVLSIFKTNSPNQDIIPKILTIEENNEDGILPINCINNGVSLYIFNNNGNVFLEALVYWFLGLLGLFFMRKFKDYQSKCLKSLLVIYSMLFVWNFTLGHVLSHYISFTFFTLLAYKFPIFTTSLGKINFFLSFLFGTFILVIFPCIMFKIQTITEQLLFLPKIVAPESSNKINLESPDLELTENKDKNDNFYMENLDIFSPDPKVGAPQEIKLKNNLPIKDRIKDSIRRISHAVSKMKESIKLIGRNDQSPFYKNKNNNEFQKCSSPVANFQVKNKGFTKNDNVYRYLVFHRDFNQNNLWQRYFIEWALVKQLVYSLVIAASMENPFVGLIVSLFFQVAYVVSFFIVRPFKWKKDLMQHLINETCCLFALICTFCIAFMEKYNINDEEAKLRIGWGVVFANLLLILVFVVRMILVWAFLFYKLIKEFRLSLRVRKRVADENSGSQASQKNILDKIIEMKDFMY